MEKDLEEKVKAALQSDEYNKAVAEKLALMEDETKVIEEAPWIGNTGLPEEWERELPRYLRREMGESLFDEDSLKAKDLEYLGIFSEEKGKTHFWRVPYHDNPNVYAYVEDFEGGCLGWGDREPPK